MVLGDLGNFLRWGIGEPKTLLIFNMATTTGGSPGRPWRGDEGDREEQAAVPQPSGPIQTGQTNQGTDRALPKRSLP